MIALRKDNDKTSNILSEFLSMWPQNDPMPLLSSLTMLYDPWVYFFSSYIQGRILHILPAEPKREEQIDTG